MDWHYLGQAVAALVPTIGLSLLFWLVMRAVLNADRNERRAEEQLRAQEIAAALAAARAGSTSDAPIAARDSADRPHAS